MPSAGRNPGNLLKYTVMFRRRFWVVAAVLAVLVAAVFGRTLDHGFVNYDDSVYVTANPAVAAGLSGEGFRAAFRPYAGNWHPLTWLSHQLDVEIFGMKPWGHHLVNVLLHAGGAIALFGTLLAATGGFWESALIAALFAVHPLHVEPVAWVAERKEVLATFLGFCTLAAWVHHRRRPSPARYAACIALYALGLAAKPMLVTLPLLLLLLDVWPLGRVRVGRAAGFTVRSLPGLLGEKTPFLALAAASAVVTLYAQHTGIRPLVEPAPALRAANAVISSAIYLRQTFWPAGLALLYPYTRAGIPWPLWSSATLLLAALTTAALLAFRRRPYLVVGWAWYLLTLLPVIGLVQVGAQAHADRYTYLPLTGIFMALAWFIPSLLPTGKRARALATAVTIAVVATLGAAARVQAGFWRDGRTLMEHAVRVTTGNYIALNNLGQTYFEAGHVAESVPYFQRAFAANPDYGTAAYNLGGALFELSQYPEALAAFTRALALRPDDLHIIYFTGRTLLQLGRPAEAARHFEHIVHAEPDFRDARFQLAIARGSRGQPR